MDIHDACPFHSRDIVDVNTCVVDRVARAVGSVFNFEAHSVSEAEVVISRPAVSFTRLQATIVADIVEHVIDRHPYCFTVTKSIVAFKDAVRLG
ncbi:hypothetical protein D3C72_2097880 [compost metagenome]